MFYNHADETKLRRKREEQLRAASCTGRMDDPPSRPGSAASLPVDVGGGRWHGPPAPLVTLPSSKKLKMRSFASSSEHRGSFGNRCAAAATEHRSIVLGVRIRGGDW